VQQKKAKKTTAKTATAKTAKKAAAISLLEKSPG
jgi:hypothetical protein